ncbi:MAG: acyltransferase family protein [Chrysiogenetes bacterium]|nr:acyltransferase family protein [Chrysiogenetes bacterium]
MPNSRQPREDGAEVEDLLDELKDELLELFDYTDIRGNRTMVRGDLVRSLDASKKDWRAHGKGEWHAPKVRYRGLSPILDRVNRLRRLVRPDFYLQALNQFSLANRSLEVDDFGMDPAFLERFDRFIDFLYERYWRVETIGIDNVPYKGRALLVANHSGTLPFDALMISAAVRKEHPQHRHARSLVEDLFMTVPFLAPVLARAGLVRGSRENAERLLARNEVVCVFPEGEKGISKYYRQRYQLQRFGRGGFVRIAMETGAPIIPVAVVGAEEIMPMIGKLRLSARAVGLPYLPVTPTWPWTGPLGLVPLPTKWYIKYGQPIDVSGGDPSDEIEVNRIKEDIRATIQELLYDLLKERKSVWGERGA